MLKILESVSKGILVQRSAENLSPGSNAAAEHLQASGFLHYNNNALSFASPIHEAIYLHSTRTSFVADVSPLTFETLLKMTITRMSSANMQAAAAANTDPYRISSFIPERQIHFEVYRALTTIYRLISLSVQNIWLFQKMQMMRRNSVTSTSGLI